MGKYLNRKLVLLYLAMLFVLFCGIAEAKGIEAGLWGIGWNTDSNIVRQTLEREGFALLNEWKDEKGNRGQRLGSGLYSGFRSDITVVWKDKDLKEINIESTGAFSLGTDGPFADLLTRFTEQYGPPQEREAHMLKIFPGVWVEGAKWTVKKQGSPGFAVTLVQNRPANPTISDEASKSTINVSFSRIDARAMSAAEHNAQGMEYVRMGKLDEAIDEFTAAIKADPQYVKAYNNRGGSYATLKKYNEALLDFNQVLTLSPNYAKAYNNRAYVKAKLGNYDEAVNDADKALTLGPIEAMFYDTRGYAYAGKAQYDHALQDLNQALKMDSALAIAYFHRAEVYDRLGKESEALLDYGKYIEYAKDDKNDADLIKAKRRYGELNTAAPPIR